jgi:SAM-dependent methyltransferase
MKDLKLVIDPMDIKGHKNRYINVLQHMVLRDILGDTDRLVALDIGCGIERFRDLFNGYYGVDINPDMHPFIQAECNDLPLFLTTRIDVVLSVWMLQYQDDLEECMDEIKRVLVPGGVLVMIEQISKEGYATVLPRSVFNYSIAFGKEPERCVPILNEGDLLVGVIRRGWVPERLFPVLARLHLMLIKYTPKGVYTDYLMVFRK